MNFQTMELESLDDVVAAIASTTKDWDPEGTDYEEHDPDMKSQIIIISGEYDPFA